MEDLRIPIGSFFVMMGVVLLIAAAVVTTNAPLVDFNVNLYCGIGNLLFGVIMLWLAWRASR